MATTTAASPKATQPTLGSLFAGIGGFDHGFEQAGFRSTWQVEIDPLLRRVLALRFPHARQLADVRAVGAHNLQPVDLLCGGFPCQDVSSMGARAGLAGERTSLVWQLCRVGEEIRPQWLVLEIVVGLLTSNRGQDFGVILQALAERGYVGCWRVLDASYFGVAQRRRRVFMVAGLGRQPPAGLLSDAAPVDYVPGTLGPQQKSRPAHGWAAPTLLAKNAACLLSLGCEPLVCHQGARGAMVERARVSAAAGLPLGLDATDLVEYRAAGNAVAVPVARWIGEHLRAVL